MTFNVYDGGGEEIDFDWVLDPGGDSPTSINDETNPPDDVAAIGWAEIDYVKDGDTYFDDYGSHIDHQNSVTPQGVSITWDDASAGLDAAQDGESTAEGWFGIPLESRSGSDPDERRIFVDYYHRWTAGRITGINYGAGGPTVSFSVETQKWVKEDDAYEKDIQNYIGGP
ncbi:hypothetical protein [Halosimplex sp. J119]